MNQVLTETGARQRVLLAEDDPAVRRSLQLLLQGKGFDVRSFASGAALLRDPSCGSAACLIADYRMPDVDGITLLEGMRSRGWTFPAVLITAFYSDDLSSRALKGGFSAVIEKPLLDRSLADTVARLVAGGAGRAANGHA